MKFFLKALVASTAALLAMTAVNNAIAEETGKEPSPALLPASDLPPSSVVTTGTENTKWMDKPGSSLKLAGYILGGISAASIVAGVVLVAVGFSQQSDKNERDTHNFCPCPSSEGGLEQLAGFISLGMGVGEGIIGLSLFMAGKEKADKAEADAAGRVKISPFINPVIKNSIESSAGVSLDGAVAGITGRF